jgi:hypothetical protein
LSEPDSGVLDSGVLESGGLESIYPDPTPRVIAKARPELDAHARRFIEMSPFCVLATSGADSSVDASPRGGHPGFIRVAGPNALLMPDRAGNPVVSASRPKASARRDHDNRSERLGCGIAVRRNNMHQRLWVPAFAATTRRNFQRILSSRSQARRHASGCRARARCARSGRAGFRGNRCDVPRPSSGFRTNRVTRSP